MMNDWLIDDEWLIDYWMIYSGTVMACQAPTLDDQVK